MKTNNENIPEKEPLGMNEHVMEQLLDFIDGTLSSEQMQIVQSHMDSCEQCRKFHKIMKASQSATVPLRAETERFMLAMTPQKKQDQIQKIKNAIQREKEITKIKELIKLAEMAEDSSNSNINSMKEKATENAPAHRRISPFSSKLNFASTAAGFIVIIAVTYLVINTGGWGMWSKSTNDKAGTAILTNGNKSGDDYGQMKENTNGAINDAAMDSTIRDGSIYPATDSGSVCSSTYDYTDGKAAAGTAPELSSKEQNSGVYSFLPNKGALPGSTNSMLVSPQDSKEIWDAIIGSCTYLEIRNDTKSYLAIILYKKGILADREQSFLGIGKRITSSGLLFKIERISGENSQKLIEYTSKENADLLRVNAVDNAADFLVISIYR